MVLRQLQSLRPWGFALLFPVVLTAQSPDSTATPPSFPVPLLGGHLDDLLRLEQLAGQAATDGFLHRSPSTLISELPGTGTRWGTLDPSIESVWNSSLPFSLNQGSMWAGRGVNLMLTTGVRLVHGPLDLIFAPQFTYSQNRSFQTIPARDTVHSLFASPWHVRGESADIPQRPGDAALALLHSGQSSVTLRMGGVRFGATTENEWWGPGVRNAIIMSSHAEGFPRIFLANERPLSTPVGSFEGRWILGGLSESLFFDSDPGDGLRALSGAIISYRPPGQSGLTLGLSRVVYASVPDIASIPGHALDAVTRWERQVIAPDSTISDTLALKGLLGRLEEPRKREQMTALFGRWIFPEDRLEVYFEWARTMLPRSIPDLLTNPGHSQGYTVGMQVARPVGSGRLLRTQAEFTYLEESASFKHQPVQSFYVSSAVPQGYTHRGRVIGASIGPGGSSQWLALDLLGEDGRLGIFGGRVRWDNNVYYRGGIDRAEVSHDVTLFGGLTAARRVLGAWVSGDATFGYRFNYLFQNAGLEPWGENAVDRTNVTIRLGVTPLR